MRRIVLGAALAGAALLAAPAQAGPEVVRCGITPRIPCGVCYTDEQTGDRICVGPPTAS